MTSKYGSKYTNTDFSKFKNNDTAGVMIGYLNQTWAIDIVFWNDKETGERFIYLNCVDVFSRRAISVKMDSKNVNSIIKALQTIMLKWKAKPNSLWSDEEGALKSKTFKKFMNENDMSLYHTYGSTHNGIVERFNYTMKNNISKLQQNQKKNNKEVNTDKNIKTFVKDYNDTYHSTLHMSPNESVKNYDLVLGQHIENTTTKRTEVNNELKVGDKVKVLKKFGSFEKRSMNEKYNEEVFIIVSIVGTNPKRYKIKDKNEEVIIGSFYGYELKKV